MWTPGAKIERFSYDLKIRTREKKNRNKKRTEIDRFHSRGQHLCKFIGTKESVYIRKEFNSHRIPAQEKAKNCSTTKSCIMQSCSLAGNMKNRNNCGRRERA